MLQLHVGGHEIKTKDSREKRHNSLSPGERLKAALWAGVGGGGGGDEELNWRICL